MDELIGFEGQPNDFAGYVIQSKLSRALLDSPVLGMEELEKILCLEGLE